MSAVAAHDAEVEPAIRAEPSLLDAVTQATDYLSSRAGFGTAGVDIRWRLATGRSQRSVEIQLSDNSGETSLIAGRVFPISDLMNPVYRDIWVLRAWRDLLSLRLARREQVIERMIQNMEESDDGGAVQRTGSD